MPRSRWVLIASGLALALGPSSPVASTAAQAGCPSPAAPLAYAAFYPAQEELPVIQGEDVVSELPSGANATPAPTSTFARAGFAVRIGGSAGDLDGDGLDEYAVDVATEEQPFAVIETYLIPGNTPAGDYDPADVGLRVAPGSPLPIGDRDGDGTAEVLLSSVFGLPGDTAVVYDGAALAALTAPSDARTTGVLFSAPGRALGLADRGGPAPDLVVGEMIGQPLEEIRIHLASEDEVRSFTTAPHPAVYEYTSGIALPEILVSPDGAFLRLIQSDRSGAAGYVWRVDDPCGDLPPQPAVSPPPAPAPAPAAPVAGQAGYTG